MKDIIFKVVAKILIAISGFIDIIIFIANNYLR